MPKPVFGIPVKYRLQVRQIFDVAQQHFHSQRASPELGLWFRLTIVCEEFANNIFQKHRSGSPMNKQMAKVCQVNCSFEENRLL